MRWRRRPRRAREIPGACAKQAWRRRLYAAGRRRAGRHPRQPELSGGIRLRQRSGAQRPAHQPWVVRSAAARRHAHCQRELRLRAARARARCARRPANERLAHQGRQDAPQCVHRDGGKPQPRHHDQSGGVRRAGRRRGRRVRLHPRPSGAPDRHSRDARQGAHAQRLSALYRGRHADFGGVGIRIYKNGQWGSAGSLGQVTHHHRSNSKV